MIELKDVFSEEIENDVFWISQHDLEERQEMALYYVHDKNVRIKHYNKIAFSTLKVLINIINYLSKYGTVYAVVPNDQMEKICKGDCPDVCFRVLSGYNDEEGNHIFTSIIEHSVKDGKYHRSFILNSSDLNHYISRENQDPAVA